MASLNLMCSNLNVVDFLLTEDPYTSSLNAQVESDASPLVVTLEPWNNECNFEEFKVNIAHILYWEIFYMKKQMVDGIMEILGSNCPMPEIYAVGDYCNIDGSHDRSAFVDAGAELEKTLKLKYSA